MHNYAALIDYFMIKYLYITIFIIIIIITIIIFFTIKNINYFKINC